MKKLDIKQLDENDEEVVDALISLGMNRPVARTLVYFQNVDETKSDELENVTGLRQPEVSITMRDLIERGWINEREEKKPGKEDRIRFIRLKSDSRI